MGNLTVKESGEMVNFISPNVSKITSFKVHFSPKQGGTGDPSPENVREITGWNGVEGYGCGKNLFNGIMRKGSYNTTTGEFENTNWYTSELLPVKPNTKYAFVKDGELNNPPYSYQFDEQKQYINNTYTTSSKIITTRNETKYIAITISANDFNKNYLDNFMICEGDNINAIRDITASIDWTEDVGTVYGGYIDLVNGELVEEWYSITFDGENVKVNRDYTNLSGDTDYIKAYWVYFSPAGISDTYCKCNTLKITYTHNKSYIPQTPCLFLSRNGYTYGGLILGKKEDYPELAEGTNQDRIDAINNWFKENPTQVIYKLKTPIIHQLTPQQILAFKGTNNIFSDASGQTEIKYWKH